MYQWLCVNNTYDTKFLNLSNQQKADIADIMTDEQHGISLYLLFKDLWLKVAEFTADFIENKSISQKSHSSSKSRKSHNDSQTSSISRSKSQKSRRSNASHTMSASYD